MRSASHEAPILSSSGSTRSATRQLVRVAVYRRGADILEPEAEMYGMQMSGRIEGARMYRRNSTTGRGMIDESDRRGSSYCAAGSACAAATSETQRQQRLHAAGGGCAYVL